MEFLLDPAFLFELKLVFLPGTEPARANSARVAGTSTNHPLRFKSCRSVCRNSKARLLPIQRPNKSDY